MTALRVNHYLENMASTHDLSANSLFSVKDYVCLVTGGGTGIGLMASQVLAANGKYQAQSFEPREVLKLKQVPKSTSLVAGWKHWSRLRRHTVLLEVVRSYRKQRTLYQDGINADSIMVGSDHAT